MKKELTYKGFIIRATPDRLKNSTKWTTGIQIMKDYGTYVSEQGFLASNLWYSEKEAIEHCFHFGIEIIDGKYPKFGTKLP